MALNTAHAHGGVLIYSGERILIYYDGVEVAFDMTSDMPHFKGNKKGRVYLTTHRIIFNSKNSKDTLQSFSAPFYQMREVELEQPIFGANYIKGKVLAELGGNWDGSGKFKLWFNNGGAIEFGQCLLEAGRRATRHAPAQPPPYVPPSGPYYQAPPPAYAPPSGPQYGFIPYQTFPSAPPTDGVFMTDAPPPYPGIDPTLPPYTPPQVNGWAAPPPQFPDSSAYPPGSAPPYPPGSAPPYPQGSAPPYPQGSAPPYPPPQAAYGASGPAQPPYPPMQQNGFTGAAAKEAEAAASAYYNPSQPHNVYMPQQYPGAPPAYPANPPAYSDLEKKSQ